MSQSDKSEQMKLEKIVMEISKNISSDSRYISPQVIRKTFRLFTKYQQFTRSNESWWCPRMYTFEREVTHYLLERCYWMKYGDSQLVADLLHSLFVVDGHLGKIFDFQQVSVASRVKAFKINEILNKTSTWSEAKLQEEKVKPIDYFMEHAYKRKLLFNGKRFAEQYLVLCVHQLPTEMGQILLLPPCSTTFKEPDVLLKLLQRGVFISPDSCSATDIGKLLTGVIGSVLVAYSPMQPRGPWLPAYMCKLVESGNILLRAVDGVQVDRLMGVQRRRLSGGCVRALVEGLSVPHLLPRLRTRCFGPPELMHLCRCQIRRLLYDNWQLPHGISFLQVPELVKRYLNLECDL